MRYAIWNLRSVGDNQLDGPESFIESNGGWATALVSDGSPEANAKILGKFDCANLDLSAWNFVEITEAEADVFIAENPQPLESARLIN